MIKFCLTKITVTTHIFILLLFTLVACQKKDVANKEHIKDASMNTANKDSIKMSTNASFISNNQPYALNVVYFIASDKNPDTSYKNRINSIMLLCQNFYKKWMDTNANVYGFNASTFGLKMDNDTMIHLTVVKGSQKLSYYKQNNSAIKTETNAYFAAHPTEKTSQTILMITYGDDHDDVGGLPFVGGVGGNYCYAVDYPSLLNDFNTHSTSYIGGLFHELGHGFGLNHNVALSTDKSVYGTSLMGSGNQTYGKSSTFITSADCRLLSNMQCFSLTSRSDWYSNATVAIKNIHARVDVDKNIIVSGTYSSNGKVNVISYYNDPGNYDSAGNVTNIGINKDYDASEFSNAPISSDSFYVTMPYSKFGSAHDGPYELTIRFQQDNGSFVNKKYSYKVANGTPVFSIN